MHFLVFTVIWNVITMPFPSNLPTSRKVLVTTGDVAQNRRDDVTFLPRLGAYDVKVFLSYIQADGYEPLTVEAVAYMFDDKQVTQKLAKALTSDASSAESEYFTF
jgi:hypothetical protein